MILESFYHSIHHVVEPFALVALFHSRLDIGPVNSRKGLSILVLVVDSGEAAGRSDLSVGSDRDSDFFPGFFLAYLVLTLVPIHLVVMEGLAFLLILFIYMAIVAVEPVRVGCQRTSL